MMHMGPYLIQRGMLAAVFFICLASSALLNVSTERTPPSPAAVEAGMQPQDNPDLPCRVSDLYPAEVLRWCGWITAYSEQHGLAPDLVAGLIWYESGGDPLAYSRSGAVGLMQVMPRDGLAADFMCVNGPCFASRPTRSELEDAQFNIEYGTRMLAGLNSRYGSLREALKRYGPAGAEYTYADKVLSIYNRYGQD
jgi:soluble lytic murein transglycosylase-like protein